MAHRHTEPEAMVDADSIRAFKEFERERSRAAMRELSDQWRTYAAQISAAKAEVDQSAPPVSDRRFAKAQKKIQSGDFIHDSVET